MQTVLERLDGARPQRTASITSPNIQDTEHLIQLPSSAASSNPVFAASGDTPSTVISTAPVFVIRDVAREVGAAQSNQEVRNTQGNDSPIDVIDSGLIGSEDALSLIAMFVFTPRPLYSVNK